MKKKIIACIVVLLCAIIIEETQAQNVGIGTASPAFKLDVMGRIRVKTGTLGNVSTSSGLWLEDYRDGANRMFIGMQDSIRGGFYGSGGGGVGWAFNFNATTGNVGIGRLASSSRLEVDDVNGGDISFYKSNSFGGTVRATDSTLQVYGGYGSFLCSPDPCPAKNLILQPPPGIIIGSFSGNVGIGTNAPTAKLHISSTVMIGSGSPASGYALSVNGKIMSEELKVQISNNWPDYVFHKEYKLIPISQLDKYIQQHQHLPNMPSAEEVSKEGLLVGDMQIRIMEKIEELTLYIIDLKKQIDVLKNQINTGKSVSKE